MCMKASGNFIEKSLIGKNRKWKQEIKINIGKTKFKQFGNISNPV